MRYHQPEDSLHCNATERKEAHCTLSPQNTTEFLVLKVIASIWGGPVHMRLMTFPVKKIFGHNKRFHQILFSLCNLPYWATSACIWYI